MDSGKVKLALGVISGRIDVDSLDNDDWCDLGYDLYSFGGLGIPDIDSVKGQAEDIIYDALKFNKSLDDAANRIKNHVDKPSHKI